MSTTQGFTLGFVLPPFQGLIAGLISMPDTSLMDRTIESRSSSAPVGAGFWEWALFHEFRPGLHRDSTRGYSLSPLRGEEPGSNKTGEGILVGQYLVESCRPFRAARFEVTDTQGFTLGFVLPPFQGLVFGVVMTQGGAALCPGLTCFGPLGAEQEKDMGRDSRGSGTEKGFSVQWPDKAGVCKHGTQRRNKKRWAVPTLQDF